MIFANLSGGRDSTTMVVKSLELGKNIDYIIFCDTGYEFPQMYEYIQKLDNFLQKEYNKSITKLDSSNIINEWAFIKPITKGNRAGKLRGLPRTVGHDYCTRESKINPSREFILSKSKNTFKNRILIGYTYNEVERGRSASTDFGIPKYPLHEWSFNEVECENYLKKRGIANPLYKHFNRTGCFMCPKQSKRSWYNLYKHYPELFECCKELEKKAFRLNCVNQSFRIDKSLVQLEKEFKLTADPLFINDYAESEVCFCK